MDAIQDRRVAKFIFQTNEAMIRRVKKSDINDILRKFDCGDGDIISDQMDGINLQPYFDAITNRHLVSHKDGVSMTLEAFAAVLPCAEQIFDTVERVIAD
ncbi:MAG: hypothetical protein ACXW27_00645 [Allosphingosinicella sp.]